MATRLEGSERAAALAELAKTGWALAEGREAVKKTFAFADFSAAFG